MARGDLAGMTMQSLAVAIMWQIVRYDHAKPWHVTVVPLAW